MLCNDSTVEGLPAVTLWSRVRHADGNSRRLRLLAIYPTPESDTMNDISRGQVIQSAAEVYDTFFVPALFGEWGPRVADAAGLAPGQTVLDVACGTGVFAREVGS